MFRFLKEQFTKIYKQVTSRLQSLFSKGPVDETTLKELERILLEADTGVATTRLLITHLRDEMARGALETGEQLREALGTRLKAILHEYPYKKAGPVYILVGVNGTGKTTFVAKLAHHFASQGKKVMVAAADTFRAAAAEQLKVWADRTGVGFVESTQGQDPSAVVFTACERFTNENYDILIIDTAGRLQTKANLMRELEKMRKVVRRFMPDTSVTTLLTVDALIGQNSFDQAKLFNEAAQLDGVILTKMDGTAKGGMVFAIAHDLKIPIAYVSFGEQVDHMAPFNPDKYVDELLEG